MRRTTGSSAAIVLPMLAVLLLPAPRSAASGSDTVQPGSPERGREALPDPRNRNGTPRGRWRSLAEAEADLSPEQIRQLEELRSIGYVGGSIEEPRSGVTVHEPSLCENGLNFYTSGHLAQAVLMDMAGAVLHTWAYPFEEIWPDSPDLDRRASMWWRRAMVFPNGDVVAIFEGLGAIRIDRDSNLIWASDITAHHDFEPLPDGRFLMLTREPRIIPEIDRKAHTLEDFVTIVDDHGRPERSYSVYEALRKSSSLSFLQTGRTRTGDVFHTNTLHLIRDGSAAARMPVLREGRIMIAMNALGVVAVLDLDEERIVWAKQSDPTGHHDPHPLPDGSILLFENHRLSGRSSVVQREPDSWKVDWEFGGPDGAPLFSETCGAASRLANGNTLITESDGGRCLEVTTDGRIVWEFYNPERAGDDGQYIATLSEVTRLPADFGSDWASR